MNVNTSENTGVIRGSFADLARYSIFMRLTLFTAHLVAALVLTAPQSQPGGDIANPTLLQAVAPTYPRSRFSNPARTVLVGLTVSASGTPENVHVVRSGGGRFDKNAIDTVAQYRFKPALKAGQPVARDIQVEVNYKVK